MMWRNNLGTSTHPVVLISGLLTIDASDVDFSGDQADYDDYLKKQEQYEKDHAEWVKKKAEAEAAGEAFSDPEPTPPDSVGAPPSVTKGDYYFVGSKMDGIDITKIGKANSENSNTGYLTVTIGLDNSIDITHAITGINVAAAYVSTCSSAANDYKKANKDLWLGPTEGIKQGTAYYDTKILTTPSTDGAKSVSIEVFGWTSLFKAIGTGSNDNNDVVASTFGSQGNGPFSFNFTVIGWLIPKFEDPNIHLCNCPGCEKGPDGFCTNCGCAVR